MAQVMIFDKTSYANRKDHAICKSIHRKYGTTYYFASKRFPTELQRHTNSLYAFVRIPDEWVDNPATLTKVDQAQLLGDWRSQMWSGLQGERPKHPVMRAFVDTLTSTKISPCEASVFLNAMEMDISKETYANYQELEEYMRGSAAAVGIMMLQNLVPDHSVEQFGAAKHLGNAMQLTNFLRDIKEDRITRNRIYIPLDELADFKVDPEQILKEEFDPNFKKLMQYQICRAKKLYQESDPGIDSLPVHAQRAVLLARILYSQILTKLEEQNCNPFIGRARTTKLEKLRAAAYVEHKVRG